ncbi:sensor histidine kinase [Actinacidiphila yanglinensis]|nr:sensor histidine kinase [Actinacidiphila yanglinensis]
MNATRTISARLRADRRVRDAAPAVLLALLFVIAPAFGPHGWTSADIAPTLLAVASCLPLVVRSRWPLAVLLATLALDVLRIIVTPHAGTAPAAAVVALYTLATLRRRSLAWPVGIASAALITAVYAVVHGQSGTSGVVLGLFDLPILATALGDTVRNRRAYLAEVEARAERAERTREQESQRAVAEERLRIARELHDVTAHHLTLVNAQAGVAHHLMRTDPDAAYQALGQIKETSRAALDELRATVGLLRRPDDDPAQLHPLPGLADLDELFGTFRASGFQVDVRRRGTAVPVATGVQLAAYRIVQEALTNARRHASGAHVRVLLEYGAGSLHITVANDAPHGVHPRTAASRLSAGQPAGAHPETGPGAGRHTGHGLIGMRERATALGGTVSAGPDHAGGYRVRAELPLPSAASHPSATPAEPAPPAAPTGSTVWDANDTKGPR